MKNTTKFLIAMFVASIVLTLTADSRLLDNPKLDVVTKCSDGVVCYEFRRSGMWCTLDVNITEKYCDITKMSSPISRYGTGR